MCLRRVTDTPSPRRPRSTTIAPPVGHAAAAADFDLVRLVNGAEVGRDRWTLSLQFTFLETVDPELMIVNPMGILITYLRGDRALVTG